MAPRIVVPLTGRAYSYGLGQYNRARLRTQRHEFGNRLHTISGLLANGDVEHAQSYRAGVIDSGPVRDPVDNIAAVTDPYLRAFLDAKGVEDVDTFVISAAGETVVVRSAFRRGALAYLVKPFDPKTLPDRLRGYARYRRQLDGADVLDQQTIDRSQKALLTADDKPAPPARAATEIALLTAVTQAGDLTVTQVAETVGTSRATAQRYLAQLTRSGRLRLELRYGSRGRPEHHYSPAR